MLLYISNSNLHNHKHGESINLFCWQKVRVTDFTVGTLARELSQISLASQHGWCMVHKVVHGRCYIVPLVTFPHCKAQKQLYPVFSLYETRIVKSHIRKGNSKGYCVSTF